MLENTDAIALDKTGNDLGERLKTALKQSADSPSTRRNRQHFWKKFEAWCAEHGVQSIPADPDSVIYYLVDQARRGQKKATLNNMRWAIDSTHLNQGLQAPGNDPEAKQLIKGLMRELADKRPEQAKTDKKKPITIDLIRKMKFPEGRKGIRDKTIMLLGFATGMRRSELAMIRREHIEETSFGLQIMIPSSKSDQMAEGETVDVVKAAKGRNLDWCPVKAVLTLLSMHKNRWLFVPDKTLDTGFKTNHMDGNTIYRIVKKYGAQVGLNPEEIGAHSLRAGCATYLLEKEVPPAAVQKQMRHKSFDTTQQYNRGETARALRGAY